MNRGREPQKVVSKLSGFMNFGRLNTHLEQNVHWQKGSPLALHREAHRAVQPGLLKKHMHNGFRPRLRQWLSWTSLQWQTPPQVQRLQGTAPSFRTKEERPARLAARYLFQGDALALRDDPGQLAHALAGSHREAWLKPSELAGAIKLEHCNGNPRLKKTGIPSLLEGNAPPNNRTSL